MNRTDELTIVRRVFVTALLLSVVHYIDNTIRFEDYTGGKEGFNRGLAFQNTFIALDFLAGLAVFVMAVRIATTRGAVSRPPTTTGRSPVGSASR